MSTLCGHVLSTIARAAGARAQPGLAQSVLLSTTLSSAGAHGVCPWLAASRLYGSESFGDPNRNPKQHPALRQAVVAVDNLLKQLAALQQVSSLNML